MTEVVPAGASLEDALESAEGALAAGGCVAFPTDTVYGLGARPDIRAATDAIFEIKRRPRALTLPVLVGEEADAEAVARLDERGRRLARAFWPGPLTLVLPRTDRSASWDLGAERETIGVRMPAHPFAAALLRRTGPLAVTSANLTGEPTPATCEGVRAALGDAVAVYVCDASPSPGVPSTVVELSVEDPRVLRAGGISEAEVVRALAP